MSDDLERKEAGGDVDTVADDGETDAPAAVTLADPQDDPSTGAAADTTAARLGRALEGLSFEEDDDEGASRGAVPSDSLSLRASFADDDERTAPLPGPVMTQAARSRPMLNFDAEVLEDWHVRASVVVVACLLYFVNLGSFGLWDPWEVHYGAVGWSMIERGDWISPWWGSYWTAPGKRMEGEYFFSKPVLLLWMMGIGQLMFGFTELGIRFGTAVIAVLGVGAAYLCGSKVWSVRVGVLMALTLATSPFYAMLSRQAQTDMPFVGLMTIALCFFMMGVFGRDRNRKADKLSWALFGTFIAAVVIPQLITITVGQLTWRLSFPADASIMRRVAAGLEAFICFGPTQLGIYLALITAFIVTQVRARQTTRGQLYLYVFYAFIGLATMAKGLLGFGLPGAIILIYLVVTREWGLLKRVELMRGVMVTIVVGMPWYGAVMARHDGIGGPWWQRFIIHDHFKRLATGVHQIDTGSFEHFIKWLGYGLFPWGSFVPAVIARALSGESGSVRTDQERARLFIFIWFAIAFTLFTMSSTKFHHYIFPAVPALALLVACLLDDLLERKFEFASYWPMYLAAAGLFALVSFDLMSDPQHLKNLFTYRYDREWNSELWDDGPTGFKAALRALVAVGAVGLLLLANPRRRAPVIAGIGVMGVGALMFSIWALNVYMPTISSSWSQKGIWDAYYENCTRGEPPPGSHRLKRERYCMDSAISYKLNWRGETYYTMNEVIPIRDDDEWNYFIEQNDGRCFYAIMEPARINAFRSAIPADQRPTVTQEHGENMKFVLMSANCRPVPEPEAPSPPEGEGSAGGGE